MSEWVDRRDFLRLAAGAAALAAGACGSGSDKPKTASGGDAEKKGTQTLRIVQWGHFIPGYDTWFDAEYINRWGEEHDVEVVVDHVPLVELPGRADTEVATQRGHDIFGFTIPPPAYEDELASDATSQPPDKYGFLAEAGQWSTNLGHPGYTSAVTYDVYNQFLIPRMFGAAAKGEMSAEEAVKAAEAQITPIFDKWRERGKI